MHWAMDEYAVLTTGVLFAAILVAGASPSVPLNRASRVVFGLGAVVFIGASFALAWVATVQYPPVMWVLPVVPLLVIGVLVRDAIVARRSSTHRPERATAVARPAAHQPLAASTNGPAERTTFGGGGEGTPSELSAYQPA